MLVVTAAATVRVEIISRLRPIVLRSPSLSMTAGLRVSVYADCIFRGIAR
jgi:hypothetical protein